MMTEKTYLVHHIMDGGFGTNDKLQSLHTGTLKSCQEFLKLKFEEFNNGEVFDAELHDMDLELYSKSDKIPTGDRFLISPMF